MVGTKKDKLVAVRKIQLLEQYMEKHGDYAEASRLANIEANKLAEEQFIELKDQLSRIEHYKADGFCCLSKSKLRTGRVDALLTSKKMTRLELRIFSVKLWN